MTAQGDLDRTRIGELHAQELARFRNDRPATMAMLERARAHMPNGVPMSWMVTDNDQPVYIDSTPEAFAAAIQQMIGRELPDVNYQLERHTWADRAERLLAALGALEAKSASPGFAPRRPGEAPR